MVLEAPKSVGVLDNAQRATFDGEPFLLIDKSESIVETCKPVFDAIEKASSEPIPMSFMSGLTWVSKNPFFDAKGKACLDIAEKCYSNNVELYDTPFSLVGARLMSMGGVDFLLERQECSVYNEYDVQKVMEEIIWEPVLISHAIYVGSLNKNILEVEKIAAENRSKSERRLKTYKKNFSKVAHKIEQTLKNRGMIDTAHKLKDAWFVDIDSLEDGIDISYSHGSYFFVHIYDNGSVSVKESGFCGGSFMLSNRCHSNHQDNVFSPNKVEKFKKIISRDTD